MEMSLRMKGRLRDRVVEHLVRLILDGRWQVGEYLPPEGELIQELGISRTAFREALSQLEARGLVESRQGIGTRVAERSQEAIADSLALLLQRTPAATGELLETRRILETEAAALAAHRATPEALRALEEALEAMQGAPNSPETYTKGDLEFHLRLALASGNAVLGAVAAGLAGALRVSIAGSFDADHGSKGRLADRLADHRRILEAIRRGDAAAAREAVSGHYDGTERTLRGLARMAGDEANRRESTKHPAKGRHQSDRVPKTAASIRTRSQGSVTEEVN